MELESRGSIADRKLERCYKNRYSYMRESEGEGRERGERGEREGRERGGRGEGEGRERGGRGEGEGRERGGRGEGEGRERGEEKCVPKIEQIMDKEA